MARLNNKKIEGSTLIEVLIAMVIIMVVFAIAIGLFSNVMSGGISYSKVQAMNQMELLKNKTEQDGGIENDHVLIDSIDYKLNTKSSSVSGMDILEIEAKQHGKSLGSIHCLYKVGKNEGF